jgi:protein-S-isoprenylcysteine O-methyltransferase Ste14
MDEAILVIGWAIYFYLHSLLAALSVKIFFTQLFSLKSARMYRIGYNIFGLSGICLLLYLQFITPSVLLFAQDMATNVAAVILFITGLVIMFVSIKNYDWKSFVGISDEQINSLVVAGINKYVRHPLYSGTILFVLGFFIWQPYCKNLLLLLLMSIYLAIGILYEERKLVKIYGAAYIDYQRRVKKMIPYIW